MNEDQNEVEAPSLLVDASGTPLAGEPTIDDKLALMREKLGLNANGDPTDEPVDDGSGFNPPSAPSGADVDWSEYDLDPKFAHLYRLPSTKLRMGPDGPAWVAIVDDFLALRLPYNVLGRQIAQMVNGPEGWRLQSAVVPAGAITKAQAKLNGTPSGPAGVVTLQRKLPIILPTPTLLKSEEADKASVPAPKEEELQQAEDAALAWIESDAGKAAPVNDAETPSLTPPSLEDRLQEDRDPRRIAEGARQAANDALKA